jgi:DNA-binding NtrC family response regulator
VVPIHIPALRDRPEDIPELIHRFWEELQRKHGIYHKKLTPDTIDFLVQQDWPGNIRELHNVLERSLTIVLDDRITLDHIRLIVLGARAGKGGCAAGGNRTLDQAVKDTEQKAISFALARCSNNRLQAAKMLGISRPLLYKKLHEFHII